MKLAVKMHRGELEPLYVPDVVTQDQRVLGRGKINASRRVTKLVNEIGSLLRSWGIIVDCSLLSAKGQKLIESSKAKLPKHSLKVLELSLAMLKMAEAAEDEDCQRLMSIPDVGPLSALVVKAEIGDNNRFAGAAALVCYSGLSPSLSQSSDSIYYGKLNKFCNKFLKYVLVLRAQGMARSKKENPMRQTYWRVALRHKSNHAKIAVARQLARVIYSMLKKKECWDASKITQRRGSRAPTAA